MIARYARLGAVLVAGALTLGLSACGDDDDGGADAQTVIDALVSEGATEDEARCFVDELGADDAERLFSADEDDLSEREIARLVTALTECGEAFQDNG